MAYLHDHGIVHRDLKPGNIFCDEGVVKVGDYGLSKFISCSRRSGHTESIGTVHYMAPEVANGRYGKEIDVYALGVILYEMLTGRVPFEGESIGEVLMKHLTAKPDVSMLPEPYRSVVARALEKDPALRFRSAAEMLAALPSGDAVVYLSTPKPTGGGVAPVVALPSRTMPRLKTTVPRPVPVAERIPRRGEWHWWRGRSEPALIVKSPRERLTELVGSLLAGSMVAAATCLIMVLLESYFGAAPRPEECAWVLLAGMAGTWAVLIPSKFCEGTRGEPSLRRFVFMVLGLGVGALAFGVAELFMLSLAHAAGYPLHGYKLPPSFYAIDGRPLMMAYVACFGSLFLLMRWWRQADPLRRTRLSVPAFLLSIAVAGAVAWAWQFPQPWLPMVAGAISASVQLASPWVHPAQRG